MSSLAQNNRDVEGRNDTRNEGRSDSRSDGRSDSRSDARNDVRNEVRNDVRNPPGRRRSLASTAVQATTTPTQSGQPSTKKSPSKGSARTPAPCLPLHRGRLLGWFVLGVACVSHMTTTGMALANVILVTHMPPVFNETTTSKAAWVISISWGFGWLLAPVVAAMCLKFGLRSTCVLGGFVAALGHLFNSFSEDLVHVFLSFSLISAAGSCMCYVASSTFISSGSGRRCRIYHASQYLGTALFAYVIDAAIRCHGWIHGLQMSTVLVGINFLLGFFYGLSVTRSDKKKEENGAETPVIRLLDIIKSQILHDRLLFYWFLVEGVLNCGLRTPLLLMVSDSVHRNASWSSPVLGLVVVGVSSFAGTFLWALPRKCVPTSSLFFLQEQMIVLVIVIALIPVAQTSQAWLAIHAVYGLSFGGLNSFMTAQVRKLIIKEYRSHADSWAMSARAVGLLFGPPVIVWLDGLSENVRLGYYVSAGAVGCSMIALLAIMRRLRIREIDIAYIEHSSMTIRPGVTVVPDRGGGGGGGATAPARPVYSYANGAVVDGLEEQDVEDMVNTDLLWRSGVLADMEGGPCALHYLGDLYDPEGEQTPEGGRRKTLAEPSLPILPEVPSQENSSISKMDCSIHSGGRRESELEALGFMGSDEVGTPNSGFAAIDEDSDRIGDIPAPRSPRSPGLGTSTPKFWARKGSLPERRSPVLKYTFRRRSADPEILKGMMYLPIPTQPRVEENFEINIVPPPKPNLSSSAGDSPITITKELPNNLPDVMEKLDPDDTVIFTETTV